jgi:hypothetical protein
MALFKDCTQVGRQLECIGGRHGGLLARPIGFGISTSEDIDRYSPHTLRSVETTRLDDGFVLGYPDSFLDAICTQSGRPPLRENVHSAPRIGGRIMKLAVIASVCWRPPAYSLRPAFSATEGLRSLVPRRSFTTPSSWRFSAAYFPMR